MTSATYQVTTAELTIGGMTCASCAARIERKLNGLDGVSAAVNFATETAQVTFPANIKAEDLVSTVERPATPRCWRAHIETSLAWSHQAGGCRSR